jgi:hypothetical protein
MLPFSTSPDSCRGELSTNNIVRSHECFRSETKTEALLPSVALTSSVHQDAGEFQRQTGKMGRSGCSAITRIRALINCAGAEVGADHPSFILNN